MTGSDEGKTKNTKNKKPIDEIYLPVDHQLDIEAFSKLFSVMNQSYKLLWFRGILEGIRDGKYKQTFGSIVNRMIADAWEPVMKYRLKLGPADAVERLVYAIQEESRLPVHSDSRTVLSALMVSSDSSINKLKLRLIQYVPYRLQSPFLKGEDWKLWDDYELTVAKINENAETIYTIAYGRGLSSYIQIRPSWMKYLTENLDNITRWADEKWLEYLQKQNSEAGDI